MITKITAGSNRLMMPGDRVVNRKGKSQISGMVLRIKGGIATVRPTDTPQGAGGNKPVDVLIREIQLVRQKNRLPAEIGCLVKIRNGVHTGTGTLERVDGAYNYIRHGDTTLELYPAEFVVQAVFRHPVYLPGTVVRFIDPGQIAWGKRTRTTHGIVRGVSEKHILVQPITSKADHLLFLNEDRIALEESKMREPMDESELQELELAKLAIRACLVTCGSMTIGQLAGLLATQGVSEESVRENVAAIIADGKAHLDDNHLFLISDESDEIVQGPVRERLFAATEAVRKAKKELADSVFATIATTGAGLPR